MSMIIFLLVFLQIVMTWTCWRCAVRNRYWLGEFPG